jgi:hypothetical protein
MSKTAKFGQKTQEILGVEVAESLIRLEIEGSTLVLSLKSAYQC